MVYPILIALSGLWFQVDVVWFTTGFVEAAFLFLLWHSFPRDKLQQEPHHAVLFLVCMAVLGFSMAHQVRRMRLLSRYYDQRL
jgi:mannose/fructose/N-acetylgalactosamine-specific phosphotransferase system component IIC